MKIRKKLSLLFVAGALLPLLVVTFFHHTSMRKLGNEVGTNSQEKLAQITREFLRKIVNDYGRILQRDKQSLEFALRIQAREIEKDLLDDTRPLTAQKMLFTDQLSAGSHNTSGMTISYKHLQSGKQASRRPIWVNYKQQAIFIPQGVPKKTIINDLKKMDALFNTYFFIYRAYTDFIYWQHTSFETGMSITYPAHSQFPATYDPRLQHWYQKTKETDSLMWFVAKDVVTGKMTRVVSLPIHFPDGSFAGVTAIDVPFQSTFQALELPYPLGLIQDIEILLVLFEKSRDNAQGNLKVLLSKDSQKDGNIHHTQGEEEHFNLLSQETLFQKILQDTSSGNSGVQKIRYRGREVLCAYGEHNPGEPFPIIFLPYEQITAQSTHLKNLVQEKTSKWLQFTGIIFFGAICLSTLLALYSAQTVIHPVMQLAYSAFSLSQGNFESRVHIRSRDELQQLGSVFNELGPQLEENERMRHALTVAREAQQYLLPKKAPKIKKYDISGMSIYSDETGGDYYDFIELFDIGTEQLGIAVGDVSGHGIGAALLMASARGVIRSHASRYTKDLGELFGMLNEHLIQDTGTDQFLTLFYGILDAESNSLRWASAGHDPAIWIKHNGQEIQELPNTGMPLGISKEAHYFQDGPITLDTHDIVLVGTDGIRETRNASKEEFGRERLEQILVENLTMTTHELCQKIVAAIQEFRKDAPQKDDITMVIVKRFSEEAQDDESPYFISLP
jgi:sigma-B regulation protein RsbU (phosphoserine phosphatase)